MYSTTDTDPAQGFKSGFEKTLDTAMSKEPQHKEHEQVHRDLGPEMDNLFATRDIFQGNDISLEEQINSKTADETPGIHR